MERRIGWAQIRLSMEGTGRVRLRMRLSNPSHFTASLGGMWTALGFVPFDIWLGRAHVEPPQLLGLIWLVMGMAFIWAPLRFLVVGQTIGHLLRHRDAKQPPRGDIPGAAARAVTWILACAVAGIALSVVFLLTGYKET